MNFNLNVYSYYSLLKSTLSIDDIIDFSLDNKLDYAILTDFNLSGSIEFYNKCLFKKIKPIIGLEINYQESNLILIAKNYQGFSNLIKISSYISINKLFNLDEYLNNDLFIISKNNNYDNKNLDVWYSDDIYINTVKYKSINDYSTYRILEAIDKEVLIDNFNEFDDKLNQYFFLDSDDINLNENQKQNFKKVILDTNLIIDDFKIRLPVFKNNKNMSSKEYLKTMCLIGLKERLNPKDGNVDRIYIDRLLYELDVITQLKFEDYFLIVSDFILFAKNNQIIIGPGRGSAAGSLVSYCLFITELDPIKYNLIFERFLNINRKSLPDIDIDVMDTRRDELIEYIFNKYSLEMTSQIITFQRMKYKTAIRDVGRILKIPLVIIDNISKNLPTTLEVDLIEYVKKDKNLKYFYEEYPLLFKISKNLYNVPRQYSTHAAGILIANEKMECIIPIQKALNNYQISQYSMEYLEMFGLNKIDILGLRNLTIIYETLTLIKSNRNKDIDINKIDLNDANLYHEISNANTLGIFQLESPGMRNTLLKIKPKNMEDISITSALFRPGPQMMINDYVKTRNDPKLIKYLNDDFKKILSSTNGFCIYQEQVIELIKTTTGFDAAKADIFRRAISKKKIELFSSMKDEFISSAIKNNYQEAEANNIYNLIAEFANYGFNHSHSLSYSFISYQMMHLKHYYPLEFIITLLSNNESSNLKNNIYLTEAKRNKIKILNVNILKSQLRFSIYENSLLFGLLTIKGIGNGTADKIIKIRDQENLNTYEEIISSFIKNGISEKVIQILIKVGSFDIFDVDRNFLLENINHIAKNQEAINPETNKPIFDHTHNMNFEKMSEELKAEYENEYLGFSFSNDHNIKKYELYKDEYNLSLISDSIIDVEFNCLVEIKQINIRKTKTNNNMAFIKLKEMDLDYSLATFNDKIISSFKINKFYILKVRNKNNKLDILSIIKDITELEVN